MSVSNKIIKGFFLLILTVSLAIIYSSCLKDRIYTPVVIIPPIDTIPVDTVSIPTDTALHLLDYWSFNTNDTSTLLKPTYTFISASISYVAASFDDVNPGSSINLRISDTTGDGLRMRNPFTSVTFLMPTTGYQNPVFTFAGQRSNSGPTVNNIYYTIDGTNFINDSLLTTSVSFDTAWTKYKVDFSGIKRISNNPKFAVQLVTGNNNTGTSGNDRYDNVSLEAYKK